MQSDDTTPDTVGLVLALDDALRTALNSRDFDTIERLYAPEFTLNSPAGRIRGCPEVRGTWVTARLV
jgi:hypothetical protein